MPEIFANQDTHAPKARIESADRVAPGKEAAFVEQPVRRQIYLVVNMQNHPARDLGGSNVETVTRVLVNEANHKVQIMTRFE